MALKTADIVATLKPTLFDIFDVSWDENEKKSQYTQFCKVEDSQDAYEDLLQYQGPDSIPQAAEGSVFERIEIDNVRSKRFTHLIYKAEIKITKEALADTKYRQITDAVKMLGRAGARTIERLAAGALFNGLPGGSELAPDGLSAFNTAHAFSNPLAGNPTSGSNAATGQMTTAVVRLMRAEGRKTRDEHGSLAPVNLTRLIVPPDLEDEASVLKESALRPGGMNNDKNITGSGIKDIVVADFLAEAPSNAATQWYMQDPDAHRLMFFWRQRPQRDMLHEEASDDHLFRLYFRCCVGYADWRGNYGSTGAGSTSAL
ncbi:MAG: hypothetical protein JSS82_15540 [Bacteroidetes bacterium]|nr:hypothetical protein [Bacteroidota bacterium]